MEKGSTHSYALIRDFAQRKAAELRIQMDLPALPTDDELSPLREMMWDVDVSLINAVKSHLQQKGTAPGNGFEDHVEPVAVTGAYIASLECERQKVPIAIAETIIQRTWRLGLLHDIERWRGYGRDHQTEGKKATEQILKTLGISDRFLAEQVLLHDDLEVLPRVDPEFNIPFFTLFAADHLEWGLEWERKKWDVLEKKGIPIQAAVIDYRTKHLDLLHSSNLLQTQWGQEVVIPYLQFGIEIARSVEKEFGSS